MAAKGVELASAYISLSVSTDGIPGQVEKALKGTGKTAEKAGRDIGRKVSDGAAAGMTGGNMSKALARELGSAGDKGSKELLRSLAAGHKQAERDAATAGQSYARALTSGSKDAARKFEADFRNALTAKNSSKAFFDEFHADGVARGQKVGTAIGNVVGKSIGVALKVGVAGAAGAAALAVGGVGTVLYKGFQRLKNIDNAKFKLQALGNSASDVKQIMKDAEASVKGTAFSLDEAATGAASAVAAGIKPGEQLTKYLTEVADTAAIAGTSFEDMAHIFNKVHTQNKAFTDDLQMLSDRGVPIFQWLQDQYHVTGAELSKMVEGGKVDAASFEQAIGDHIGGAAKKMGESLSGSIANFEAAMGRLGAAVLEPLFGNAAGGVGSLTDKLDDLTTWVKQHRPEVVQFFTDLGVTAVSVAQDVVKSFANITKGAGDFIHAIGTAVSVFDGEKGAKLQAAGDSLNSIGDKLITTADGFDTAKDKILGWGDAAKQAAENAQGAQGPVTGLSTALGALPLKKVIQLDVTGDAESKVGGIGDALGKLTLKPWVISVEGTITAPNGAQTTLDGVPAPPIRPFGEAGDWFGSLFSDGGGGGGSASPGSPGVRFRPGQTSPPGSGASQNPLDVFAPGGHPGPPQTGGGGNSPPQTYGLPAGANSGGYGGNGTQFPPWVNQVAQAFGLKPSTYAGHQTSNRNEAGYAPNPNGQNRGIDWSGPPANMQRFADYLATIPQDLEQVIWNGGGVGSGNTVEIAGGRPQPGYFAGDLAGHGDHVHTRQSMPIPLPRFATGGAARGPGSAMSDSIPAWLSNGEHVLTANDVAALGGQGGVYALRNALHRSGGGPITWMDFIKQGASGGGGDLKGPGVGDIGRRIDSPLKPANPEWGDRPHGIIQGPAWRPRGVWKDTGTIAPWWMFPGEAKDADQWGGIYGMDPHGPDWKKRRGVGGFAEGGAVTPEMLMQLLQQGVDPNSQQHGTGEGQPPGPTPDQLAGLQPGMGAPPDQLAGLDPSRSKGFIPAAAGFTGKTGGGLAGSLLNMGAEAINGLIDQAAGAASMGANMAAPGAGMAIQMGAQIAKRTVQWGAEMGGIGIGALSEILLPFGAPRWLSDVDASAFMPSPGIQPAAVTTGEQAQQAIAQQQNGVPPGPGQLGDQHGLNQGVPPGPPPGVPPAPPPGPPPHEAQPAPPMNSTDPMNLWRSFLPFANGGAVFDNGGVLGANSLGVNLSKSPEYVFTQKQFANMAKNAEMGSASGGPLVHIDSVNGFTADEVGREIGRRTRLASMQYRGRP